jgi:hypothetical protein
MPELFVALPPEERRRLQARYLDHLRRRDGVPDRAAHRFSVRESFFADVEARPVRWAGAPPIAQADFDRHHARFDPRDRPDEATLWALCVAKANRGEKYGVEYAHAQRPCSDADQDDPHAYVEVEEFYHTRILRDVLDVLGLRMEVSDPPLGQRLLIKAMVHLPARMADAVVYCGEITGVVLFQLLLERARRLFAAQPGPLARIEELFAQIMVDEVGHVHFVRSRLDQPMLSLARHLLPLVARGVGDGMPELWALLGRAPFLAAVAAADVEAAAAPYADRFQVDAAALH